MSKYKAVILAGGKGTRLYPVTKEIPKSLLPVGRKPILNHLVDLFLKHGVQNIAISVNKEFLEEFKWWKKRFYPKTRIVFFAELMPSGTFGALQLARTWIGNSSFFLSNGDELKSIDLKKMAAFHKKKKPTATIALAKVSNPQDYGVVLCRFSRVLQFVEKPQHPPSSYINSGLYLLSKDIFSLRTKPGFSMIEKDVFPQLAKEGKLAGFKFQGKWMDCGTWERYEKALKEWNP